MCTLLSTNRAFWAANIEAVHKRIMSDATTNSDGFALIMVGSNEEEVSVMRGMCVDPLITALEEGWWERFWFHCRNATWPGKTGLPYCHGWEAGEWYLMHNGIVSNKDNSAVDSQALLPLLRKWGMQATVAYCHENESFCNLFLINPSDGKWAVSRSVGGTLFTDGNENYSTHEVGEIKKEVERHSALLLPIENFAKLPTPTRWKETTPALRHGEFDKPNKKHRQSELDRLDEWLEKNGIHRS